VNTLTEKQRNVLEFIRRKHMRDGQAPSVREIAEGIGVRSSSTAYQRLDALRRKGYISTRRPEDGSRRIRGVSLTKTGIAAVGARTCPTCGGVGWVTISPSSVLAP
jgi:repressor LexA